MPQRRDPFAGRQGDGTLPLARPPSRREAAAEASLGLLVGGVEWWASADAFLTSVVLFLANGKFLGS